MSPTRVPSFTAAHWVGDGVHHCTANVWATTHPPLASGLAEDNVLVFGVPKHTDRRTTRRGNASNLSGRQTQLGPLSAAGLQSGVDTGRAAHLSAASRLHLDAVNRGPSGDRRQGHRVAALRLDALAGFDLLTRGQPLWSEDISLLTILVLKERDAGRAVRVVLDTEDRCNLPVLRPTEVDDAIQSLMATATVPDGDLSLVVATTMPLQPLRKRLLRTLLLVCQLGEVADRRPTATRRRRLVFADAHDVIAKSGEWKSVWGTKELDENAPGSKPGNDHHEAGSRSKRWNAETT